MSQKTYFISDNSRTSIALTASARQAFREDSIVVTMYYVGQGETIVISRRNRAILVDGGSGAETSSNDALGQALAGRLSPGSLRAILASHPHQDHTNFYHALVTQNANRFEAGAVYFDNGTPRANSSWQRLQDWQPHLPFRRESVLDQPAKDPLDRIPGLYAGADAHLLRSTTSATSSGQQAYWSVFLLLRFRKAWMLFTGDAYKSYENLLLPRLQALTQRAHLLKVTHHGSSDGTSPQLVASLRPAISIASTDLDPSHRLEADVRASLSSTEIYATYEPGLSHPKRDIIVRTDGRVRTRDGVKGILFEVATRKPALV
ncbi:MAG: MBL fold metallo-hydrolase [Planctomycetes bacterium]|nr:MBL fold metallo-hydrolase [Planctomycetota bacterium]